MPTTYLRFRFSKSSEQYLFFRNNCKLFSWMYPIAVNTARDFIRARDRRRKNEGPSLDDEERLTEIIKYCSSNSANPYEALINVETQTILQAAVDELSESHREVIVLRHYMQMEYREISELLNVQEGTIRSRVHYAHEKLKDILKSSKKESLLKKIGRKLFGGKKPSLIDRLALWPRGPEPILRLTTGG